MPASTALQSARNRIEKEKSKKKKSRKKKAYRIWGAPSTALLRAGNRIEKRKSKKKSIELCLHPRCFSAQEIEVLVLQLWHLF